MMMMMMMMVMCIDEEWRRIVFADDVARISQLESRRECYACHSGVVCAPAAMLTDMYAQALAASNSAGDSPGDNCTKIAQAGAVELLTRALAHAVPAVQRAALATLVPLSHNTEACVAIARGEGVPRLGAMLAHALDDDVQQSVLQACDVRCSHSSP
jgi:hypothetical protein